jgi:predicted ATP-dependent endonuclease of OLD family
MKLDKLTIYNFKNLQDFEIDFNEKSLVTVLIGQNGTGKSNLLEALAIIFRDLDLGETPTFKYQIGYICRGVSVRICPVPGKIDSERSKPERDQQKWQRRINSTTRSSSLKS